jgi:hypothetical protein
MAGASLQRTHAAVERGGAADEPSPQGVRRRHRRLHRHHRRNHARTRKTQAVLAGGNRDEVLTRRYDAQHLDIPHNDTQYKGLFCDAYINEIQYRWHSV